MRAKWVITATIASLLFGMGANSPVEASTVKASMYQIPSNRADLSKEYNFTGKPVSLRGSDKFQIDWQVRISDPIGMVVGDDGTIYVANQNKMIAVNAKGKKLWEHSYAEPGWYQLIMGADGTIYAYKSAGYSFMEDNKPGKVLAFDSKGELKWQYSFAEHKDIFFSFAVGDDRGNLITLAEDGIISIAPGGKINWINRDILVMEQEPGFSLSFPNVLRMMADKAGHIFVGTNDMLYALDRNGQIKWQRELDQTRFWNLYSADNGNDVAAVFGNRIVVLDGETGAALPDQDWRQVLRKNDFAGDGKGGFYTMNEVKGSLDGIAKTDISGIKRWQYKIRFPGYREAYGLQSDQAGNVYFLDNGGSVYSLDPNGNERFILIVRGNYGHLVVGADQAVYTANEKIGLVRISPVSRAGKIAK